MLVGRLLTFLVRFGIACSAIGITMDNRRDEKADRYIRRFGESRNPGAG